MLSVLVGTVHMSTVLTSREPANQASVNQHDIEHWEREHIGAYCAHVTCVKENAKVAQKSFSKGQK